MISKYSVAVIGAGQAGLATSYFLKKENIDHIILERETIGSSWKNQRWDSFKTNTPNWMNELPGLSLDQKKHDFFMTKDELTKYLQDYAQHFQLPVAEYSAVKQVIKENEKYSILLENEKKIIVSAVVVASGGLTQPNFPNMHQSVPKKIYQIHASNYKNPEQLPSGNVLIVGAGQSGCQIAEELAKEDKKVYLASSKVPRARRRYRGKDIMEWMDLMGNMDITTADLTQNPSLNMTQPQSSGMGTMGHTISYQSLASQGVTILGGLKNIDEFTFHFHDNASQNILFADQSSRVLKQKIDHFVSKTQISDLAPIELDPADSYDQQAACAHHQNVLNAESLHITSIIWSTGFGYDFGFLDSSFLDDSKKPQHNEGKISEGLYCIGLPWLRKKKSGLIYGISEDAAWISEQLKNELVIS